MDASDSAMVKVNSRLKSNGEISRFLTRRVVLEPKGSLTETGLPRKLIKGTFEYEANGALRDSGKDTLFLVAPYDGCSNL